VNPGSRLAGAVVLLAAGACSKEQRAPQAVDAAAGPSRGPAPSVLSSDEGRALVKNACLSCHSDEMLAQQRLTPTQWSKEVTKMAAWGANLEPGEVAPLAAWLASAYGPDAGPYAAATIAAADAPLEIAPQPDGPFAGGDPERGAPLYADKCSGCRGPDARGHIGVLLVDRPILYRAPELAETVRRGRGKMAPLPLTDAQIADILAHLRRLKT
jgi:hypothetical protein